MLTRRQFFQRQCRGIIRNIPAIIVENMKNEMLFPYTWSLARVSNTQVRSSFKEAEH